MHNTLQPNGKPSLSRKLWIHYKILWPQLMKLRSYLSSKTFHKNRSRLLLLLTTQSFNNLKSHTTHLTKWRKVLNSQTRFLFKQFNTVKTQRFKLYISPLMPNLFQFHPFILNSLPQLQEPMSKKYSRNITLNKNSFKHFKSQSGHDCKFAIAKSWP